MLGWMCVACGLGMPRARTVSLFPRSGPGRLWPWIISSIYKHSEGTPNSRSVFFKRFWCQLLEFPDGICVHTDLESVCSHAEWFLSWISSLMQVKAWDEYGALNREVMASHRWLSWECSLEYWLSVVCHHTLNRSNLGICCTVQYMSYVSREVTSQRLVISSDPISLMLMLEAWWIQRKMNQGVREAPAGPPQFPALQGLLA